MMGTASKASPKIPEETFHAARRIYSTQNAYLRIGDQLGQALAVVDLLLLDPTAGLGGDMTLRHALITAFQYMEGLPDQAASEATLRRMDWRYALYLPANHPGIPQAALCRFRQNLYSSPKGMQEFSRFFAELVRIGLPAARLALAGEVLSGVCKITRLYRLNLAMKLALGVISSTRPDWLRTVLLPHWYERYKTGRLYQSFLLGTSDAQVEAMKIGADISVLLSALEQPGAGELADLAEIRNLRKHWEDQFIQNGSEFHWRLSKCESCQSRCQEDM